MKRLALSILLTVFGLNALSQDVIYLLSNEQIEAQITEVTGSWIKYKRFDNLDGPLFSIPQKEVQKVTYANGTEQTFRAPVDNYGRSYEKNMKKYKHRKVGGAILTSIGGAAAVTSIPIMINNGSFPGMGILIGGVGMMGVGIPLLAVMNKYKKRALKMEPSTSFAPTIIQTSEFAGSNLRTGNAVGLSFSLRF